jgi:short subunit dehydrogenase-like uncharacterized protein
MTDWMIYGANGYTGALIAREAAKRGHKPVLAGRNADAVARLAAELQLPYACFPADVAALGNARLVLNCAGPFSATARPMMQACLQAGAHYLDITGEIAVFEYAQTLSAAAKAKGMVVCPGVGFDVIPTDCVALALKGALPDATHLALGFETRSALSAGTAKTSVEGMALGGKIRRNGRIVTVPMGFRTRKIDFGRGAREAMVFPWGDVSTAFTTTGIPNIEVFLPAPKGLLWAARAGNLFGPLLALGPVQRALKQRAGAVVGPSEEARAATPCFVWGEARNAAGVVSTARITTANGYDVTVHGSMTVVEFLLGRTGAEGGSFTPALLCGAELIERLPGSGKLVVRHRRQISASARRQRCRFK